MSDISDPHAWETRYREGNTGWDLLRPAPGHARYLRDHPGHGARAVVLGAGRGYDALAYAQAGYAVTAVDFAPSAIASSRALLSEQGVPAELLVRDLFTLVPEYAGRFDVVVEHTCLCAIDPARREAYARLVHDLLAPGGRLVAVFFTHREAGGPPFAIDEDEIRRLFGPSFTIDSLTPVTDSVARRQGEETFGILTRKPG